jgi:hypothetical protein
MKPAFELAPALYARMIEGLSNLMFTESLGGRTDMHFYEDDLWLSDTAVISRLQQRLGLWEVMLVFAHYRRPLTFICRRITRHSCPRRAGIMAHYIGRQAAKDQRGTLRLNLADLSLSIN